MLSRSSKTNISTISSPESVSPLQKYLDELQSRPVSTFPSIEEQESDGKNESSTLHEQETLNREDEVNLVDLMPSQDFGEIFTQFFVAGHKRILLLQSEILSKKDAENTFLTLGCGSKDLQTLRKHYYQLQMVLFRSPKGRRYDCAL